MRVKLVEGVPYYPHIVRFKLSAGGQRRRWIRWSPGYPWVRDEVGRELIDRFGTAGVKPHSCTIRRLT